MNVNCAVCTSTTVNGAQTKTVLPARQCRQCIASTAAVAVAVASCRREFCTQFAGGRSANAAQSNWYLLLYLVYDNAADLLLCSTNAPLPATVLPLPLSPSLSPSLSPAHIYYDSCNISGNRHEKVFCCFVCYTRLFYGCKTQLTFGINLMFIEI